jgi:hypothetical protein
VFYKNGLPLRSGIGRWFESCAPSPAGWPKSLNCSLVCGSCTKTLPAKTLVAVEVIRQFENILGLSSDCCRGDHMLPSRERTCLGRRASLPQGPTHMCYAFYSPLHNFSPATATGSSPGPWSLRLTPSFIYCHPGGKTATRDGDWSGEGPKW